MCGGFVAVTSQCGRARYSLTYYHLGRLITYLVLGITAGLFGSGVDQIGEKFGIFRLAAIVSGGLMILSAVTIFLGKPTTFSALIPEKLWHLPKHWLAANDRTRERSGFFIGLSSTLLPCGWLYTYVAVAAASATPLSGALIMFIFWLGTLPLLLTFGSLTHFISLPLRKYLPKVTALLMLIAGAAAISGHLGFMSFGHVGHQHVHGTMQ
jgi:uncharacterized protein